MSEESQKKTLAMAANVLEYHQRSAQALYDRLLEKGAEAQDAAYAVARLQSLGYLNDIEYGCQLVRDLSARGYGKGRIRQTLRQKQLSTEDAEAALAEYRPNGQRIRQYLASRLPEPSPDRKALKRAADGLFRRGFSWEEIQTALRDYQEQMEDTL